MRNHNHRPFAQWGGFSGLDYCSFGGGACLVAIGVLRIVCPRRVAISAREITVISACVRERNREQAGLNKARHFNGRLYRWALVMVAGW